MRCLISHIQCPVHKSAVSLSESQPVRLNMGITGKDDGPVGWTYQAETQQRCASRECCPGTDLRPSGPDLYSDSGMDLLLRFNSCHKTNSHMKAAETGSSQRAVRVWHTFLKPGNAVAG